MKKTEVNIVPCTEEYVDECARISIEAYEFIHECYIDLLTEEIHEGIMGNWRERKTASIKQQQRGENAYVALIDGKVVGFIAYCVNQDGVGEILNNAVDSAYRGMGIGGKMYEFVIEKMRKDGALYAMVTTGGDEGHAPARKAYEKAGFKHFRPSRVYYRKL